MSKFHSTVSRRDFMKGLGLAGAGLGAAAATAPVFSDLDALAGSSGANYKEPWYVKEKELKTATAEVDWSIMEKWGWGPDTKYNFPNCGYAPRNAEEEANYDYFNEGRRVRNSEIARKGLEQGVAGFALRDVALRAAAGAHRINEAQYSADGTYSWVGPNVTLTVPKYTGTPEDNTNMLRAAAHFLGSPKIGIIEIDSDVKKLFHPTGARFEDIDVAYQDKNVLAMGYQRFFQKVVPNKARYLIELGIRQPVEMTKRGNTKHNVGSSIRYSNDSHLVRRTQTFIKNLGYMALSDVGSTGGFAWGKSNCAFDALTGLGENCRIGMTMTHEWGPAGWYSQGIVTALPLAPTKPIAYGGFKFCETCKICAETCMDINGATPLSLETEPTWEVTGPWNRIGKKSHQLDWTKCMFCPYCQGSCPFSNQGTSGIHTLVKASIATTPIFNGFFTNMEQVMGYGLHDETLVSTPKVGDPVPDIITTSGRKWHEEWWNRNLNTYPYDCIWGTG